MKRSCGRAGRGAVMARESDWHCRCRGCRPRRMRTGGWSGRRGGIARARGVGVVCAIAVLLWGYTTKKRTVAGWSGVGRRSTGSSRGRAHRQRAAGRRWSSGAEKRGPTAAWWQSRCGSTCRGCRSRGRAYRHTDTQILGARKAPADHQIIVSGDVFARCSLSKSLSGCPTNQEHVVGTVLSGDPLYRQPPVRASCQELLLALYSPRTPYHTSRVTQLYRIIPS